MKNPNTCSTNIGQTTDENHNPVCVIEFVYGSKRMAEYDLKGIKDTYANASSVTIKENVVTVFIPVQ